MHESPSYPIWGTVFNELFKIMEKDNSFIELIPEVFNKALEKTRNKSLENSLKQCRDNLIIITEIDNTEEKFEKYV
jgi:hypothetical protein